jgi:ankyrin repeat protein
MRQKTLFDDLTLEEAKELIKNGADVNEIDLDGNLPILFVSSLDVAQFFIQHGANVNFQNNYGVTPLHLSVQRDDLFEITKLFIDNGADVNAKTTHGLTPLFYTEDLKTAELLVDAGININERSLSSESCLSNIGDGETIEFLIKNGAISPTRDYYNYFRSLFSKEQQDVFDMFLTLTNDDNDFFAMCLAYQEGIKNNVTINIKEINIL